MSNSLLPPSSRDWLRYTEAGTARLSAITVALRTLWTPTDCPANLLPYLAWALSVDHWDKNWPAERKIAAIQRSYWLHRRKGTRAAVRRVIEDMGFSATFAEWFETGGEPGTFSLEVDVNETGLTARTNKELDRLISDAKPVSRHISKFSLSTRTAGIAHIGSALVSADIVTVYPEDFTPELSLRYNGIIHYDGNQQFSGD